MFSQLKLVVLALTAALAAGGTAAMASPDLLPSLVTLPGYMAPDEAPDLPPGIKKKQTPMPTVVPTTTATPNPTATVAPSPTATPEPTATPAPSPTPTDEDQTDEVEYRNHGAYVSDIAKTTPPGPGHGQAVRDAAHSDIGKAKFADEDDSPPGDEETEAEDEAEDVATSSAKRPAPKVKPAPKAKP